MLFPLTWYNTHNGGITMDLTQMVLQTLGQDKMMDAFSKTLNEDPDKIAKAATTLVPALFGGMQENIKSENGLTSLMSALDDHKNDKVESPNNFLKNLDLKDGEKILGHLLGTNKTKVQKEVSKSSGLSGDTTGKLMMMLAPLVMGYLGGQKKKDSGFDSGMLVKMLAGAGASTLLSGLLKDMVNPSNNKTNNKKEKDATDVVKDLLGNIFK